MVDRLTGDRRRRVRSGRPSGICIAVKSRIVAAGDFQTDAMSFQEHKARRPQSNRYFFAAIVAVRLPLKVTTQNALGNVVGRSVRKHVHEFASEIGVRRGRGDVEDQVDGSSNFEVGLHCAV